MYRNNKNLAIMIILACMLTIAIGYAAFNQRLNIDGVSNISSVWSIKITKAELASATGGASEISPITYNELNADFNIGFTQPGDAVNYAITVTNEGTFNATLDSIKINLSNPELVNFKVEGIESGELLKSGESKTFNVEFKYNDEVTDMPDVTDFTVSMETNYLQEGASTNFSDAEADTVNELAIKNITVTPSEYSIEVNVDATNAVKYYYSIDNNTWFESINDIYTLADLEIVTDYTVYVKAEDEEGNVVISSINTATVDLTKPTITYEVVSTNKGDNNWYKDFIINISTKDNVKVSNLYTCVTENNTCEPTTEVALTDNEHNYIFQENKNEQRVCMKAIDESNNSSEIICTPPYLVDGVEPTLNSITVTPDDDTMTITLEATDASSGLYTYYYSKDSGTTYIESSEPNYTFTNLDEGDYLIVAYVKDEAGNVSTTKVATTTIRHKSWCEENNITDLGDCIIATEGQNADVEIAKANIEAKGEPNFSVSSPSIIYEEKHASTTTTVTSTAGYFNIGTGYTFNTTTGQYTPTGLKQYINPTTIDFTSGDYYLIPIYTTSSFGPHMYKITNITSSKNETTGVVTYTITKYDYTQNIISYDTTDVGMYSTVDADNNNTYYYRGSVGGNYVKFADKYWRIIRVNGDGSVRIIYDGNKIYDNQTNSTDERVTTQAFNKYINDNTYVGYMYGDESKFVITDSGDYTFPQGGLSSTANYAFGTSYTFDESTRTFKLAGDIIKGPIGTDKVGYYTCWWTNENDSCQRFIYTTKYNSTISMQASGLGYGTTSYEEAHANITNSNIKNYLENTWFPNNLADYKDKLAGDAIFCNNRTPSDYTTSGYTNKGYGLEPTYYAWSRFRVVGSESPTLECTQNDSFTVDSSTGNGMLNEPVGLITVDEAMLAGGTYSSNNELYYLNGGGRYWTMTPARMDNWFYLSGATVQSNGKLEHGNQTGVFGVRPVINLDTSKITFTGNGTKENPYIVS